MKVEKHIVTDSKDFTKIQVKKLERPYLTKRCFLHASTLQFVYLEYFYKLIEIT